MTKVDTYVVTVKFRCLKKNVKPGSFTVKGIVYDTPENKIKFTKENVEAKVRSILVESFGECLKAHSLTFEDFKISINLEGMYSLFRVPLEDF